MPHDLKHVGHMMGRLETHGIITWLFGGWAEELHEMIPPQPHRDIDLLYRANDFLPVDQFMREAAVEEVSAKRLPHKRAFIFDGVMTELILVRSDLTTLFWDRVLFSWPVDVFSAEDGPIRLASAEALAAYRRAHPQLRWAAAPDDATIANGPPERNG